MINFTPATYDNFRVGVPKKGMYKEVFNSDLAEYGGSGVSNKEHVKSDDIPLHGMEDSVAIKLPPLGGVILKRTTVRKTAAKKTADKKPAAKRK